VRLGDGSSGGCGVVFGVRGGGGSGADERAVGGGGSGAEERVAVGGRGMRVPGVLGLGRVGGGIVGETVVEGDGRGGVDDGRGAVDDGRGAFGAVGEGCGDTAPPPAGPCESPECAAIAVAVPVTTSTAAAAASGAP